MPPKIWKDNIMFRRGGLLITWSFIDVDRWESVTSQKIKAPVAVLFSMRQQCRPDSETLTSTAFAGFGAGADGM